MTGNGATYNANRAFIYDLFDATPCAAMALVILCPRAGGAAKDELQGLARREKRRGVAHGGARGRDLWTVVQRDVLASRIADLLASATESAQAAEARYRNGVGSLLELLTAQADLARARQTAAQSESDWLAAYSRFSYALGRVPATASTSTP